MYNALIPTEMKMNPEFRAIESQRDEELSCQDCGKESDGEDVCINCQVADLAKSDD